MNCAKSRANLGRFCAICVKSFLGRFFLASALKPLLIRHFRFLPSSSRFLPSVPNQTPAHSCPKNIPSKEKRPGAINSKPHLVWWPGALSNDQWPPKLDGGNSQGTPSGTPRMSFERGKCIQDRTARRPLLPMACRWTIDRYGISTGHRSLCHPERHLSKNASACF